jgi:hypothetical protein
VVLLTHLVEYFEFYLFLLLQLRDILKNFTDLRNVVGHDHASKCLNEHQAQSLKVILGGNIAKTNSEHNSCAPIVPPNVFDDPIV